MTTSLEDYLPVVGESVIDRLQQIARPLKGLKVVHVNSTRIGGGVAEILNKLDPLMSCLGLDSSWETIEGNNEFFHCTKSFHNALQGNHVLIPKSLYRVYEEVNRENVAALQDKLNDADFVIIHDPQPLQLIEHFPKRKGHWVWRCHIDASHPYRPVWNYLKKSIVKYDASVFTIPDFAQQLPHPTFLIAPSIDPLTPKNMDLSPEEIANVFQMFTIDPDRPMVVQVSRYDRFKDPIGVVEAYRLCKKFYPGLQLVLAGGSATDDPEGEVVLNEVTLAAEDDPDIKLLMLPPDAARVVNALQRAADIVIQKSVKEGFGLTVTEGLWKGKPVIGGNVGGIRLQVKNYENGFLVNSPEGAAQAMRYLLRYPDRSKQMGEAGKELVREKFLITRHLREYLTMMLTLLYQSEDRILLDQL